MTPSDWIAIGALIVAAASILFSYLTNKENIKARRADIVKENSIDAFRDIVKELYSLDRAMFSKNPINAKKQLIETLETIANNKLYIPEKMDSDFSEISMSLLRVIREYEAGIDVHSSDVKELEWFNTLDKINSLIVRIQKYIGLEDE